MRKIYFVLLIYFYTRYIVLFSTATRPIYLHVLLILVLLKILFWSLRKFIFVYSRCFFIKITQLFFPLVLFIWAFSRLMMSYKYLNFNLSRPENFVIPSILVRCMSYIHAMLSCAHTYVHMLYTRTFYVLSVLCPTLYTCATHSLAISSPHLTPSLVPHQAP